MGGKEEDQLKDLYFIIPYKELLEIVHSMNNCIQVVTFLKLKSGCDNIANECIKKLGVINTSLRLSRALNLDIEEEKK